MGNDSERKQDQSQRKVMVGVVLAIDLIAPKKITEYRGRKGVT